MPDPVQVIVVGGGIAGMVAARDLAIGGQPVLLVEASDVLGGKVARHTVGGIQLDAGAESFATRGGIVADLATELGLGDDIVTPNPAGAWLQPIAGPALPMPRTGMLGIPATPLARDVIAVVGIGGSLRAQLDSLLPASIASKEHELGSLVRRRMGRRVLERLVAPVVMGVHSRHPDELAVDTVIPGLRAAMLRTGSLAHAVLSLRAAAPAGSAVAGIRGGIYRLVEALQADLLARGVEIRTGARVVGASAGEVVLDSGESLYGTVILAAPIPSAGETEHRAAIDGGESHGGESYDGEPYGGEPVQDRSIVLATLIVDLPQLDFSPRGTGLLVAAGAPGIRAKALTHATSKWLWLAEQLGPHRHVLRLSYDGDLSGLADFSDLARADAEKLLGIPIPANCVLAFEHVNWSAAVSTRGPSIEGTISIGERVSGTGLAAVVAHARQQSESLLNNLIG